MGLIPARKGVAVSVRQGQRLKVINTHGKQVVDFWAFNPAEKNDFQSMVHTRTVLARISIRPGDSLYSTRRKAMLTLLEDTTPGAHDLTWAACDAERYRMQGVAGYHDNCSDNLHRALREAGGSGLCPAGFGIADDWTPDPLNLFMNVAVDHRGRLEIRAPLSEKGQYVVFEAKMDLVVVMSACPQDLIPVNGGGGPADCEYEVFDDDISTQTEIRGAQAIPKVPASITKARPKRVKVALSIDFDALSHWLGSGGHPENNMADYSTGIFSGQVGSMRLLNLLTKMGLADKVTWFIPGHTIETFPASVRKVVASGAEIGLHGYTHEGIHQMTPQQERDVLVRCIDVATRLCDGKRPCGYRAPMYTVRETTVQLLREHGFLYESSLMHHDSQLYWTPADPPPQRVDFSRDAYTWLYPSAVADLNLVNPLESGLHPLVEIPSGWYDEDMIPMQFLPHWQNSNGFIPATVVEQMWKDKFMWLWDNSRQDVGIMTDKDKEQFADFVFPILIHPDTSGMAHIIGMIERVITWLKSWGDGVEFCTHEQIAKQWLAVQQSKIKKNTFVF